MRMRLVIQLPTSPIGYVCVELGGGEIRVAEHFLHRTEVGAALEQVRRERVPEQVWVHAFGLEAGLRRESAQNQKNACARQPAAFRVEEELWPVAGVQVRTSACEVPSERLRGLSADWDDAFLRAFAHTAHEARVEIDARLVQPDRLAHA